MNGIRCIAILVILMHHIERAKIQTGVVNFFDVIANRGLGTIALNSFFILSGFVITFLLFKEKEYTKTISVRRFYFRRLLRIVPLYLLIVFISFFLLPKFTFLYPEGTLASVTSDFSSKIVLFLLLLPHISKVLHGFILPISHLWSIGVEEQFYAFWPWLIRGKNNFLRLLMGVLGSYYMLIIAFYILSIQMQATAFNHILKWLWLSRIDMFVFGGITAYIVYTQNAVIKILSRVDLQWVVYVATVLLLLFNIKIPFVGVQIYGLLSCYFILNITTNKNSIIKLETRLLNYLGRISYGIYVFHPAVILICLYLFKTYQISLKEVYSSVLFSIITIILSIFTAALSYELMERRILRYKSKFAVVKTEV